MDSAGIDVEDKVLIDEPNAAFLSWLADDEESEDLFEIEGASQNVLVFDFGAGTCDVSILESRTSLGRLELKNLSISKFAALGGDDFDREIALRILLPILCEQNGIDENGDLNAARYRSNLSKPLSAVAEQIKIEMSNRWSNNPNDIDTDQEFSVDRTFSVNFQGEELLLESPSISYGKLGDCINSFINSSYQEVPLKSWMERMNPFRKIKKQTIFDLIDEALGKIQLNKSRIDHLLFIGGSSNIPHVQESLEEYFEGETNPIYPDDMQTHVSKGVAIQSFLSHGMGVNPIEEIISEGLYLEIQEGPELIVPSSSVLPFEGCVGKLVLSGENQNFVEMPFYSGPDHDPESRRIVANISFEGPQGFDRSEEITLTASIDSNKIVDLHAGTKSFPTLVRDKVSPLANHSLDDYNKQVKELRKRIFDNKASGFSASTIVEELLQLHDLHQEYEACLDTLEEFDHGNLVNKTYYAGKAGLHEEELKFAKQAYEQNPSGASAHNLALRFPNGSDEKRKYLTIAVDEYDLNFSKFAYSHLIQDENPERARRLIEEAFEHYNIRYEENREDLNISELGMLLTLARRLGRHETASSIDSYFQSRERLRSKGEQVHGHEHLLRKND